MDGDAERGGGRDGVGTRWSRALGLPSLQEDVAQIDVAIRECLSSDTPLLDAVLAHVMASEGKRMRSVLTLCAAYTGGCPPRPETVRRVAMAAAAIELVHAGTLCHDDVIDDADLRRGLMSAKRRWTNSVAVIAGDFLLARASALVAVLGHRQSGVMAEALGAICRGQMIEMSQVFDVSRTEDVYLESIAGKTAALLVASCRLGAIEGGLDATSAEALEAFGHHLGVLFQITDDILDLDGNAEALGKPACNDLINGVYTLPTIRALQEHDALRAMLGGPLTPDDAVEARDMVEEAGGLRYARVRADWHAQAAQSALDRVQRSGEAAVGALGRLLGFVHERALAPSAEQPPAPRGEA
jgi:heptaprenyl diphosphate synthase